MRSYGWALIQYFRCTYKKKLEHRHREKTTGSQDHVKKTIYKPRRETPKETNPANTLILDF